MLFKVSNNLVQKLKAGELKAMIPLLFPDNSTMHVAVQFGSK
jgi:hypothetical protein